VVFFGPVWKPMSPSRTINLGLAKISGSDPGEDLYAYPTRLGYWPAAIGLFGSTALDSFKDSTPGVKFIQSTSIGAAACPTSSRTRSCRSSWVKSWPTT